MYEKERKSKPPTNNINININLKLQAKHNQHAPAGKKIVAQKEVTKLQESIRPTLATDALHRKKLSCHDNHKNKLSVQEFNEDRLPHYLHTEDENRNGFNHVQRGDRSVKLTNRKRLKSKSLENLKVRYYAKSPESMSRSKSQLHSRSKSKSKSKSMSKSKSKSRSRQNRNREDRNNSPGSFLHSQKKKGMSKSKSKSRSKSPLISKKRSLQVIKMKENGSAREAERERSKDIKNQRNREKNVVTAKKSQNIGDRMVRTNVSKKLSEPLPKTKIVKSRQKLKQPSPIKKQKSATFHQAKPKSRKGKKSKKPVHIYPQLFLDSMATRLQSFWRGYIVRKRIKEQLNQVSDKIRQIKGQMKLKNSKFWQGQSSHSIIQLQSESSCTIKSKSVKNNTQRSVCNQSNGVNPQFMQQLQKLRRKLQEQEDRFKTLAEQNNELRANLSKIGQSTPDLRLKKGELQMNRVVSMRIESEESEREGVEERREEHRKQVSMKRRDRILQLPAVIKTEESKEDIDYAQLKKKMQLYECSPKNQEFNVKFNKNVIRKLFSRHQEKLNQKYFRKNNEYKDMLLHQLVSPKTYNIRCSELQSKFTREKQQTLSKYREAERALLLVAELDQEHGSEVLEKENQNKSANAARKAASPDSGRSGEQSVSPHKNVVNLYINVDEIESNAQKYVPILSNHSHREHEADRSREDQDLSSLYCKVMAEKTDNHQVNRNVYLSGESEAEHQEVEVCPSLQGHKVQESMKNSRKSQFSNRGFETNLRYIRVFYIKFCEYFREVGAFRQQVCSNVSEEVIFDRELYLRSFRFSGEGEQVFPYFKLLASYNTAVAPQILYAYYQQLVNPESALYSSDTAALKRAANEEYEELGYSRFQLKQHHDLALIDAFNESFNYERPGGCEASNIDDLTQQYGAVYRSRVADKLGLHVREEEREESLNVLLGNTIGRIINEWACSLCGFINDSLEEEEQIEESKVEEIRMHRLSLMLEKALLEEESSITNTHHFRLATKLEVAGVLAEQLIDEFLWQMEAVRSGR